MKLIPGKYVTRDGCEAIVRRVGALVASGYIVGGENEVWGLDGRWLNSGNQHGRDLVALVAGLEVVQA